MELTDRIAPTWQIIANKADYYRLLLAVTRDENKEKAWED